MSQVATSSFFAQERAWIDQLVVACGGMTVAMDRFLEQAFFNQEKGRALILQPAGRFGYFYLRTATFDDEMQRRAELKALVDLMMLLTDLRDRGWLVVLAPERAPTNSLHFVGTLFDQPKASTAHVTLNARGDFSFNPEAIQNADNDVIYKGVRLEGDLYRLVQHHLGGTAYTSQMLVGMAAQWRLASNPTRRAEEAPSPRSSPSPRWPSMAKGMARWVPWLAAGVLAGVLAAWWQRPGQQDSPVPPSASPASASPAQHPQAVDSLATDRVPFLATLLQLHPAGVRHSTDGHGPLSRPPSRPVPEKKSGAP